LLGLDLLQPPVQVVDNLAMLLQRSVEFLRCLLQLALQSFDVIGLLRLDRTRGQANC
jgi:hypothetical protein